MSNLQIEPPGIYFVTLPFSAAGGYPTPGTGFIDNFPVNLPARYTRVCKLSTDDATGWPINNIFLHWQPFNDAIGSGNNATGRLIQLGGQPNVFPLELGAQSEQWRKYHFPCGIPATCFLSADWQGAGTHNDVIAFYNNDFDVDLVFKGV